jgi:hypothetical protein
MTQGLLNRQNKFNFSGFRFIVCGGFRYSACEFIETRFLELLYLELLKEVPKCDPRFVMLQ